MGSLSTEGRLANSGNRLGSEGKVVKSDGTITAGPFVELKEVLGGYIIVSAEGIDEASRLAQGCPILSVGGSVEIRPVVAMSDNS